MEFSSHPATAAEPPELLQIAPVQNVDCHVGVVSDIEATLRLIPGEVYGNGCSNDVGVFADKLFSDETAFAGFTSWISARFAKHGIIFVKHLNAIISTVADIELAVVGYLDAMHRVAKECRLF